MTMLCRMLGHRPSKKLTQRDPATFVLQSECARCAAPLIRAPDGWEMAVYVAEPNPDQGRRAT